MLTKIRYFFLPQSAQPLNYRCFYFGDLIVKLCVFLLDSLPWKIIHGMKQYAQKQQGIIDYIVLIYQYILLDKAVRGMDITEIEMKLENIAHEIYVDAIKEERRNYKTYEQILNTIYSSLNSPALKSNKIPLLLANGYYNLAKITNRPKYIENTLFLTQRNPQWVLWVLQMIALTSARGNHQEAHLKAVEIINVIEKLIRQLVLSEKLNLFVNQIIDLLNRKTLIFGFMDEQMFKEFQTGPKFPTTCPLVTKKFHIADIMAMEAIQPPINLSVLNQEDESKFFTYIVYLSIACFTRATQKFYCHETSEKDYHMKAIQIASYIYPQKSTYIKFLQRTFVDHYKKTLENIVQEEENLHQLYRKVERDEGQVSLTNMPWEIQEQEIQPDQPE